MERKKIINSLSRIANSHAKALRLLQQSVDYARDEVIDEACHFLEEDRDVCLLGVKNTETIPAEYISKLKEDGFLFHTLDKINEKGRAIYTQYHNPLTARPMTGSSATTCIHILQDINQVGIGTDGGGSVLAPALSCGLYAIMAKGLGLKGKKLRVSTDGIPFQAGIGIIAQEFKDCERAVRILIDEENKENKESVKPRISFVHFAGKPIEWIKEMKSLFQDYSVKIIELEPTQVRDELIKSYFDIIEETEIIILQEGPIDLYGLGDSVIGAFGVEGKKIQKNGEKYFVKIANIVNATAIALPSKELSQGYLVMAREGIAWGLQAIEIAGRLAQNCKRPEVYENYFFSGKAERGFIG